MFHMYIINEDTGIVVCTINRLMQSRHLCFFPSQFVYFVLHFKLLKTV